MSYKIDWTTIESGQINYTNSHVEAFPDRPLTIMKFGRFVWLTGTIRLKGYSNISDVLATAVGNAFTFPASFKPIRGVSCVARAEGNMPAVIGIGANGSVTLNRLKYTANTYTQYEKTNPVIDIALSWISAE